MSTADDMGLTPGPPPAPGPGRRPRASTRAQLIALIVVATVILLALGVASVAVERATSTPLIAVGARAPRFALPSTSGGVQSLAALQGHPVLLAFVPSVRSALGQAQLRALEAALPTLRTRGVKVLAISTDEAALQRVTAHEPRLSYPLLAEAPTRGEHPAGSAYGVYHLADPNPGPVDANALILVDGSGIVRAVRVQPARVMDVPAILVLVDMGLGLRGGGA
ncbi:MAG: redoxin domain-containing protein [Ktedonobacterales bacterium]|nr:redoxin domain-containing protein [Ktedonobacterales bacterium]